MHFLKRLARGLSSQLFKFSVLYVALATATVVIFGVPATLKSTIKDSGVYDKALDGILVDAKKDIKLDNKKGSGSNELSFDDPAVESAIKTAIPSSFLEQSTNTIIDGLYGWLEGKTAKPEITLDLKDIKQNLATGIADVAYKKALNLPACTLAQLQSINVSDIDINNLPCLPPSLDLNAERDKIANKIANSDEFISDTTLTLDDITQKDGKTVFEFDSIGYVPTTYQWLVKLPWIIGVLAIIFGVSLLLLHDERRRAIWVIGRSLLSAGILLIIGALLINYVATSESVIKIESLNELQKLGLNLARNFIADFNNILMMFGAIYIVVGAGTMIYIKATKPKSPKIPSENSKEHITKPAEPNEKPEAESVNVSQIPDESSTPSKVHPNLPKPNSKK